MHAVVDPATPQLDKMACPAQDAAPRTQVPPAQTSSVPQGEPQVPQLLGSLSRSTQVFPQSADVGEAQGQSVVVVVDTVTELLVGVTVVEAKTSVMIVV